MYSARARRVIALANPQKGVRGLFGSSGKFSRLDALGENGVPSRWFPKGKGYCVTQTGGDATGGGEGGSRAIKSRCGFSNPLREASQSPTVTWSLRCAGSWGPYLNVLDHVGSEELAAQQSVPKRGNLQLTDQPHPVPPQEQPVSLVHGGETAGTPVASVRFRASVAAPRLSPGPASAMRPAPIRPRPPGPTAPKTHLRVTAPLPGPATPLHPGYSASSPAPHHTSRARTSPGYTPAPLSGARSQDSLALRFLATQW